ncbi:MAG: biotin transporter BioY [Clostridia bacterium]|nr:biotin transporter BioY [Clostridia bacterium]
MKSKYRSLTHMGLFCAFIAVCSLLSVPFEPPFTLQTLAVFLCVGVLGPKKAIATVVCYLALGAAGLPVFAGFRGGVAHLVGATGGFLIGFVPAVAVCGWLPGKLPLFVRMLCGLAVLYLCGVAWQYALYVPGTGLAGVGTLLLQYVLPFVLPDVAKLALAAGLAKKLKQHI